MKKTKLLFLPLLLMMVFACKQQTRIEYPQTRMDDVVDNYFGTEVADPFRWLEDDRSEETAAWVEAQNKVTFGFLEKIPFRNAIKERLTKIWDYPRIGVPFWEGDYYFFFKNNGMQNQSVLYIQEGPEGEPRVFLDPNTFSEDGTVSLASTSLSKNAQYMAYSISKGGSDWNEIYVMDVKTGQKLEDKVEWVKFSGISWFKDGFFYSRYDAPKAGDELKGKNEFHKVYYHKIGTPQSTDILVHHNPQHPLRNYGAGATEDERFIVLYESQTTSGNALYVKDMAKNQKEFAPLIQGFDFSNSIIDNVDDKLLLMTNKNAPKYQLVLIDPANPAEENWKIILPEQNEVLQSASLIGGKIIARYMKDASSKVLVYETDGTFISELKLPTIGTVGGFSGKKDQNVAYYAFTSFTYPTVIFKLDVNTLESQLHIKPDVDFDIDAYETKQVFYTSKDGTKVPMFIVHKKGLKLNGKNPTLLYGYGGFNASLTPSFSISRLILLENDGVYAMANIRGGGEYGKDWHEAGTKLQKQNVFDDFIAAAEYLINEKYTSPKRLAIQGGSNGGLLVGAAMAQRPELFKVAFPAVGVMDMLRFHKFTIGWAWTGDYGSSEDSTQFRYLLGYSPLHNLKDGVNYPATLITTADHDDRVVPAHSFKFAAELQRRHDGSNPVLIRIETKAGHGAGKPTAMIIDEHTDIWSFMLYNMGVKPKY